MFRFWFFFLENYITILKIPISIVSFLSKPLQLCSTPSASKFTCISEPLLVLLPNHYSKLSNIYHSQGHASSSNISYLLLDLQGSDHFLFIPTLQQASGPSNFYHPLPSEYLFPTHFFCCSTYHSPSQHRHLILWPLVFPLSSYSFSLSSESFHPNLPQYKVLQSLW